MGGLLRKVSNPRQFAHSRPRRACALLLTLGRMEGEKRKRVSWKVHAFVMLPPQLDSCSVFPLVKKHWHCSPFLLVALKRALTPQIRVIQPEPPREGAQESLYSLCLAPLHSTVFQKGDHDLSTCIPSLKEPQRIYINKKS